MGVGPEIGVTGELAAFAALVRGQGPTVFKLLLGCAGWAPGQLEGEISAGGWLPTSVRANLVLGRSQMPEGAGPLLSFELACPDGGPGSAADADAVVSAARLIVPATSFGGVESIWERRARWAAETAPPALIRMSAGVEPVLTHGARRFVCHSG